MKACFLLALSLGAAAGCLSAAPLCTNSGLTLASLQSTGCEAGGVLFYNFSYSDTNSNNSLAPQVAASAVNVTGTIGGSIAQPDVTFSFTVDNSAGGAWVAKGSGSKVASNHDLRISYLVTNSNVNCVTCIDNVLVTGSALGIIGETTWRYNLAQAANAVDYRGSVTASEVAQALTPPGPSLNLGTTLLIGTQPGPGNDPTDTHTLMSADFDQGSLGRPASSAAFDKDIVIYSGKGRFNAGIYNHANLINVTETTYLTTTATPEPLTFLMLGGGLVGLSMLARKTVKRRMR